MSNGAAAAVGGGCRGNIVRGVRQYVTQIVRHSDNINYYFPEYHYREPAPQNVSVKTSSLSSDQQSKKNMESVAAVSAAAPTHVSSISMCAWYTRATLNPDRVICFLFVYFFAHLFFCLSACLNLPQLLRLILLTLTFCKLTYFLRTCNNELFTVLMRPSYWPR